MNDEKFESINLGELLKRPTDKKKELAYKRGFKDGYDEGWVKATEAIEFLKFLKKFDMIKTTLMEHAICEISEWKQDKYPIYPLPLRIFGAHCVYCGGPASELDHVIPRSKGGKDALENLVPTCKECNRKKGTKTLYEWGGGKHFENERIWRWAYMMGWRYFADCAL